jgi:hypothetical protein
MAAGGNQQEGVVAQALPQPLIVRALDTQGNPVRGARVDWLVASGGGTITPVGTNTDNAGEVRATWTLGPTAGPQSATAEIGTVVATFTATATAGPAVSVTVTLGTVVLDAIGATTQAQIVARDAQNNLIEGRTPTWASTNTLVVTVTASGVVEAASPGTARIRATLDGVAGEADVTVEPQPASIVVDPPAVQLSTVGAMQQFQAMALDRNGNPVAVPAAQFVWSSSSAILTVSPTGLATAQGNGIAQVRASLGTLTGVAQVTIIQVATSLTVSPKTDTLTTGRPIVQLTVVATDANNQPIPNPAVTWSSADTGLATVTPTGLVQAVSNGVVRVRAMSGTASDSATITIRLNTPPKPVSDLLAAARDMQFVLALPGLLANDTLGIPPGTIASFGGGSLGGAVTTYAAGTTAIFGTGGNLRVNADGSLTFMPSAGFTGSFTFQYRAQNVAGTGDATVTIDVGVGPVAVDDGYATQTGVTLTVVGPGIRGNDTLGFPVAAVASIGGGSLPGTAASFAAGSNLAFSVGGFIRVDPDGGMTFTPPSGFTGDFTVLYRLANGVGTSDATITITVMPAPEPDLPTPEPDLPAPGPDLAPDPDSSVHEALASVQSPESERTGSIVAALRAGSQDPSSPTAPSVSVTAANVSGSAGLTSNRIPAMARVSMSARAVPRTSPIAMRRSPWESTSVTTERPSPPIAMRTPSSTDLRVTPYDATP